MASSSITIFLYRALASAPAGDSSNRVGVVLPATARPLPRDPRAPLHPPKKQRPGVGCDPPAVETGDNLTAIQGVKIEAFLGTLCRHRSRLLVDVNLFSINKLCHRRRLLAISPVRNPG